MNFTDSSVLNVRASSSASLMTTAAGVSGSRMHLADRHAEDEAVEDRHPLGPPPLGGLGDQRVDRLDPRRRVAGQRRGELAQRVGRRIGVGPLPREKRLGRAVDVAAADVPLIQDLQRRLARAMTGILLARARHDAAGGRVSCATTDAISIAATAASCPLFDGPSPARASASSTELVVSTPNVIGTPVGAGRRRQAVRPQPTRCNPCAAFRRGSGSRGR